MCTPHNTVCVHLIVLTCSCVLKIWTTINLDIIIDITLMYIYSKNFHLSKVHICTCSCVLKNMWTSFRVHVDNVTRRSLEELSSALLWLRLCLCSCSCNATIYQMFRGLFWWFMLSWNIWYSHWLYVSVPFFVFHFVVILKIVVWK